MASLFASVTSEEIIQIKFCGVCLTGSYSWMGVQASCGRPISIKKHILCFTCCLINCSFEQTLAYSTFWMATFKILAKTVFVYESAK